MKFAAKKSNNSNLIIEKETDSGPEAPMTAARDMPSAPPIPQLPNKYHFKDRRTLDRVDRGLMIPPHDAQLGLYF